MRTHKTTVEIILPTTCAQVCDLLYDLHQCLEDDIVRYKKAHKVTDDDPAVKSKAMMALIIRKANQEILRENQKIWGKV